MKKIFIVLFFIFCETIYVFGQDSCSKKFGLSIIKDYNSKIIVSDVISNSAAYQNGIDVGFELLKINDKKLKKNNLQQLYDIMDSLDNINFTFKTNAGYIRNYSLEKTNLCILSPQTDKLFDTYWHQIVPNPNIDKNLTLIDNTTKLYYSRNTSNKLKARMQNELSNYNYYNNKKIQFTNGYNACKMYNKNSEKLHNCLSQLVERERAIIMEERTLEQQRKIHEQQLQQQRVQNYANNLYGMQMNNNLQNITKSLNNINYSIYDHNYTLQNTNYQLNRINNTLRGW